MVRGPDHPQLLFFGGRNYFGRGHNNFGRVKGKRARPLYIYFSEVIYILGETVVRGPDHSTFIFSRS